VADFILGKDCKAYRNTGNYGTPVWAEMTQVRDVKVSLTAKEWEGGTRGSGGWEQTAKTRKAGSVDFNMVYKPNDAGYEAIRDSFINNTLVDLAFASGVINTTGTEYFRAEMDVFKFERGEALDEGVMIDVTVKPRPSSNARGRSI
jgi:hypothetical protein